MANSRPHELTELPPDLAPPEPRPVEELLEIPAEPPLDDPPPELPQPRPQPPEPFLRRS